ncbi:MAG: hypothetical protein ACYCOU_03470 [Sulfobacillus sp.]
MNKSEAICELKVPASAGAALPLVVHVGYRIVVDGLYPQLRALCPELRTDLLRPDPYFAVKHTQYHSDTRHRILGIQPSRDRVNESNMLRAWFAHKAPRMGYVRAFFYRPGSKKHPENQTFVIEIMVDGNSEFAILSQIESVRPWMLKKETVRGAFGPRIPCDPPVTVPVIPYVHCLESAR